MAGASGADIRDMWGSDPTGRIGFVEVAAILSGLVAIGLSVIIGITGSPGVLKVAAQMLLAGATIFFFAGFFGRVFAARYISAQMRVIESARREVEEDKSEFLARVNHELRTPLTVILGLSSTVIDIWPQAGEDVLKDLVRRIVTASGDLNKLIGNLLEFSRLEAGHAHMDLKPCNVGFEAQRVVDRLAESLKDHVIHLHIPERTIALCDPNALRRILESLLSNAAKFSKPGSLVIARAHTSGEEVVVSVDDHGLGIPAKDSERVFDRFYRLERGNTASVGGIGLGLSIARRLAEAQGGRIWVETSAGRGSTFSFTLRRFESKERAAPRKRKLRRRLPELEVDQDEDLSAKTR